MLILSRQNAESIHLGDHIVLTVVSISHDKVRIGVQAPPGVRILRTELGKLDGVAGSDVGQARPLDAANQSRRAA